MYVRYTYLFEFCGKLNCNVALKFGNKKKKLILQILKFTLSTKV